MARSLYAYTHACLYTIPMQEAFILTEVVTSYKKLIRTYYKSK